MGNENAGLLVPKLCCFLWVCHGVFYLLFSVCSVWSLILVGRYRPSQATGAWACDLAWGGTLAGPSLTFTFWGPGCWKAILGRWRMGESRPHPSWCSKPQGVLHGPVGLELRNPNLKIKVFRISRRQLWSLQPQAWGSLWCMGLREATVELGPALSSAGCCIHDPTVSGLARVFLWPPPDLPPSCIHTQVRGRIPRGLPAAASVPAPFCLRCCSWGECCSPPLQPDRGCSWGLGPKESRIFSRPLCLHLLLPILVKRSPHVKKYLCPLSITLPFCRKMSVTFPSWQQQNLPPALAVSDWEVLDASQGRGMSANSGPGYPSFFFRPLSTWKRRALGQEWRRLDNKSQCMEVSSRGSLSLRKKHRLKTPGEIGPKLGIWNSPSWVQAPVQTFSDCVTLRFHFLLCRSHSCFIPLMWRENELICRGTASPEAITIFASLTGGNTEKEPNSWLQSWFGVFQYYGYHTILKHKSTGIFVGTKYCYFYNSKIIGFNYYNFYNPILYILV